MNGRGKTRGREWTGSSESLLPTSLLVRVLPKSRRRGMERSVSEIPRPPSFGRANICPLIISLDPSLSEARSAYDVWSRILGPCLKDYGRGRPRCSSTESRDTQLSLYDKRGVVNHVPGSTLRTPGTFVGVPSLASRSDLPHGYGPNNRVTGHVRLRGPSATTQR